MTSPPNPNPSPTATEAPAIHIRMYRLGVGDCFLLALPRGDGTPFHLLIDCGIHAAETDGPTRIRKVAEDIRTRTGGKLDLIVGTHEHWDHLSGFFHAADIFKTCTTGAIWCAWTEDERDAFARSLLQTRAQGVNALWGAVRRVRMAGGGDAAQWDGSLGFFGDSPGTGTHAKAAAEVLRGLAGSEAAISYLAPGGPPFESEGGEWRIFVLGPPRDRDLLNRMDPRKGSGEAYPFGAAAMADAAMAAANLAAAVGEADDPPFASRFQIPLEYTRDDAFFGPRYWGEVDADADAADPADQRGAGETDFEARRLDWRRLGDAWLGGAEQLALHLDKIVNNTSLVLAIEVGPKAASDNPVLLFAADAQIGNWLSWSAVEWPDYGGRKVTGADLVRRTVLYKVGHHASQNATLMQGGLEAMARLRLALVPTSAKTAGKVGWGTLPWPALLTRLDTATGGRVVRSDEGASPGATEAADIVVRPCDFCFDITFPLVREVGPGGEVGP
ncbi:MAG: hypothetical protein BGP12_08295 [Rhodospirillales bacterium 70-18]|nr:hypothetical protein [Rhodospirillales bacterium]OJY73102.1 MAG: hypothetical protein BGP12_08295 [Rhodospirillales bacterium 70-18]